MAHKQQRKNEIGLATIACKDIFFTLDLPIAEAILAGAAMQGDGRTLNSMASVAWCWHNALAPELGACIPALTRQVTLYEKDMLAVAGIARPWWRHIVADLRRNALALAGYNLCNERVSRQV